ncbi:MAG: prepilin peptidase [Catenulispora sp.]
MLSTVMTVVLRSVRFGGLRVMIGSQHDLAVLSVAATIGCAAGIHGARAAATSSSSRCIGRHQWVAAVAGIGALAGAAIGAKFGVGIELAAYLLLVAVALPLSAIDIAVRKVPDRILLPAVPAAIAILALAALSAGSYSALGRALLAGVTTFTAYLALALGTGELGFGDCKAAGLCGIFLGYLGWSQVFLGTLAAFVLAALVAATRFLRDDPARTGTVAFAPYIFAGAVLTVTLS